MTNDNDTTPLLLTQPPCRDEETGHHESFASLQRQPSLLRQQEATAAAELLRKGGTCRRTSQGQGYGATSTCTNASAGAGGGGEGVVVKKSFNGGGPPSTAMTMPSTMTLSYCSDNSTASASSLLDVANGNANGNGNININGNNKNSHEETNTPEEVGWGQVTSLYNQNKTALLESPRFSRRPTQCRKSKLQSTQYDGINKTNPWCQSLKEKMHTVLQQIPAVALACILTLMCSVPFGSAYFPIEWKSQEAVLNGGGGEGGDSSGGVFPIPGKDTLGIRMLLFSTVVSQIVFCLFSSTNQAIGLQMVENVPFLHAYAYLCFETCGYGAEALSTLMVLFGLSSIAVGVAFFCLGYFQLGKVVYYFPRHVLVGCIGGIGIFIIQVAIEVTTDVEFNFTQAGLEQLASKFHLLAVVLAFEALLRTLIWLTCHADGTPQYPLLAPLFYCLITPMFFIGLKGWGLSFQEACQDGYFFPPPPVPAELQQSGGDVSWMALWFNAQDLDMWRVIDLKIVSWSVVYKALPTMLSLVVFSLMHVPINVPSLAISTGVDVDMNVEMKAHGYSNVLSGVFGGLQNYLCYSNSVVYAKLGGEGRVSSFCVALLTGLFFFIGPSLSAYIPRCMAGTLLLHVGIDLFLEGVYHSYGHFDRLEYSGIWLVTVVMAFFGMSAGLVAGIISALSTYAVQSITYQNPIRGTMSAATLRSGRWARPGGANAILDDPKIGRKRIFIIQLQGHLFFGTVAQLNEEIDSILKERERAGERIWIVILDFSLVLGIDSSAAQAIGKIKDCMHRQHDISFAIYVTGSKEGFPCECNLSADLAGACAVGQVETSKTTGEGLGGKCRHRDGDGVVENKTSATPLHRLSVANYQNTTPSIPADHVCESLESALEFAEDVLIARVDPSLLVEDSFTNDLDSLECETQVSLRCLKSAAPGASLSDLRELFSFFHRESWKKGDVIWRQGSKSTCAKLLVRGNLLSLLEDEAGTTEDVPTGNVIGELGLVNGTDRLSTVKCISDHAVLYSLEREDWDKLVRERPGVARCVDLIALRYLAHRVQKVSNRIFETRCLPV